MESKRFGGLFRPLWRKITFSRLTLVYFIFSFSHFAIQLAFQVRAFAFNSEAHHVIDQIVHDAGTVNASLPFLRGSSLYLCSWIPSNLNTDGAECAVIWSDDEDGDTTSNPPANSVQPTASTASTSSLATFRALMPTPKILVPSGSGTSSPLASLPHTTAHPGTDKRSEVQQGIEDLPSQARKFATIVAGTEVADLSQQCLWALNWPNDVLRNTQRQDSVFIAFQFWVLSVSIRALWNQSIPHILASLLTHVMATTWGVCQITNTANFRADFKRVIINGACKQTILNASYWKARRWAEIASLSFNGLALIISCALTWKLIQLFGWQTFKRVGASLTVNRIYQLVFSFSVIIQLSFFFMVVTASLWIDQLMNSGIGDLASFIILHKVTSFVTLLLLIPWLLTGWFAVVRELRLPMLIFLCLSILYLAEWGAMFFSTTFRWTFITWTFFSVMASASFFLTLMAMILGFVCRYHFGDGLSLYLNTNQPICEDEREGDVEKFAVARKSFAFFGEHEDDLTNDLGFKSSFDATVHFVTLPPLALHRNSEDAETHRNHKLKCSISSNSHSSYHSRNSSNQSHHIPRPRWIIE